MTCQSATPLRPAPPPLTVPEAPTYRPVPPMIRPRKVAVEAPARVKVNVCISDVRIVPPSKVIVPRAVSTMRQGSRPGLVSLRAEVTQYTALRVV